MLMRFPQRVQTSGSTWYTLMQGTITATFYAFTRPDGSAILDEDGFPTPSPLSPASECDPSSRCTNLGKFSFVARRVKAN
jgi:hypothetical protein